MFPRDELISDCGCGGQHRFGSVYRIDNYIGSCCACGARFVWPTVFAEYLGDYQRPNDLRSHLFQLVSPVSCFTCGARVGGLELYCQGHPMRLLSEKCPIVK